MLPHSSEKSRATATGEAEAAGDTSKDMTTTTTLQPKDLAEVLAVDQAVDQAVAEDQAEDQAEPEASVSRAGSSTGVGAISSAAGTVTVSTRRSSARSTTRTQQLQDPVIAPGFGTLKDLQRLARELSAGNTSGTLLPVAAV